MTSNQNLMLSSPIKAPKEEKTYIQRKMNKNITKNYHHLSLGSSLIETGRIRKQRKFEGKIEPKPLDTSYYPSRKDNLLCSKNPFNNQDPDYYSPEKISERKKDYFARLKMFGLLKWN